MGTRAGVRVGVRVKVGVRMEVKRWGWGCKLSVRVRVNGDG